jgi:hypothetical protein
MSVVVVFHPFDMPPLKRAERPKRLDAQRAAANEAWNAANALLEAGAQAAGAVLLAELQRAVHSSRLVGLHRLAAAGARVSQGIRDLHAERPEFRLESLLWDMRELLATAHALRTSEVVEPRWIGTTRRAYAETGPLQLVGLFTEPVVSGGGYAGVVTYLVDQDGLIWSLGEIAPGDAERCYWSYITALEWGGATFDHQALSRGGLCVERARAAANRRLGSGRTIVAQLAQGAAWASPPLGAMWGVPLAEQLDRVWAARERSADERRAGDDLVFVRGFVVGADADALLLRVGRLVLRAVAPSAHVELVYRSNLRRIAGITGLELSLIGRVASGRPRTLLALALDLGEARYNLGLDTVDIGGLEGVSVGTPAPDADVVDVDPLDPLRRRLQQVVLGGRSTLGPSAWSGLARDERQLARNQMPTAAEVLGRLRSAALAEAWLAAHIYLTAADARLQRATWLG